MKKYSFLIILIVLFSCIFVFVPIPTANAVTTSSWRVSGVTNDCYFRGGTTEAISITGNILYVGDNTVDYYDFQSGFRFQNISVPSGATIISAYLNFTAYDNVGVYPVYVINGEDADDPVTFSTIADFKGRAKTTATVEWTPSAWTQWEVYATSDLSSIVQEIIDRDNWESSNDMAFFCKDKDTGFQEQRMSSIIATDYSSGANAVYLYITWDLIPNYISLFNQVNSVFMINGVKITNGTTEIGWTNGTVLELQGVINISYTFIEWDFVVSNAEINPYNYTVAGNDTIWLMVDPINGNGDEIITTLFLFGSVNAIPMNLLYYIALTTIGLTLMLKSQFLGKLLSTLLFAFQAIWISGDILLDTQINYISAYNTTSGVYQYVNTVTHINTPILSFLIILSIGLALKSATDTFSAYNKRKG